MHFKRKIKGELNQVLNSLMKTVINVYLQQI